MNQKQRLMLTIAIILIAASLIIGYTVYALSTLYSTNAPEITTSTTIQVELNGTVPSAGTNTQVNDGSTVTLSVVTAAGNGLSILYSSVAYYYTTTAPTLPLTSSEVSSATAITTVTSSNGGSFSYTWTPPSDESVYVFAVAS